MKTEDLLRQQIELKTGRFQVTSSAIYHLMRQQYGGLIWSLIPSLLKDPCYEKRHSGILLAGGRRPESTEAMLVIAPFMRDPHPLVRYAAFRELIEFSWVEKQVEELAFAIQEEEEFAADQVPRVMAIRLLLKADFQKYREQMTYQLEVIRDLEFCTNLVTDLVAEAYRECGGW